MYNRLQAKYKEAKIIGDEGPEMNANYLTEQGIQINTLASLENAYSSVFTSLYTNTKSQEKGSFPWVVRIIDYHGPGCRHDGGS